MKLLHYGNEIKVSNISEDGEKIVVSALINPDDIEKHRPTSGYELIREPNEPMRVRMFALSNVKLGRMGDEGQELTVTFRVR